MPRRSRCFNKIYTEEFKLEFFPAKPSEFISELYKKCEANDLLKPLPKVDPNEVSIPDASEDDLKNWIAKGEAAEAIKQLKVFLKRRKPTSYELSNSLIGLSNRFSLLKQRERRGTIDSRDFNVENNQITDDLLALITESQKIR